jgi:hypothetical protein
MGTEYGSERIVIMCRRVGKNWERNDDRMEK